ncbi:MAG: hypothetical protein U9N78_02735 [Actinomycetota bacterium]|nr:hypothetical protein [Actinomycetota bacterium]
MVQNPNDSMPGPNEDLDSLETDLQQSEPAEAPEKAEEIARRLGDALDDVDGGAGSGTP